MKELSIEEKAKAYDNIIEKAYKMHHENCEACQMCIEELIPELKESEDERIRKELITHCRNTRCVTEEGAERIVKWISWLEKQGNLMKALQISNAEIGELIEKNYYLKEQLEKQGKNNMGISEATKQKLEDNLNKALEKETPESWNKFLDEQSEQKMKTPEESLGIDSDTYNKIVDECIYGEQKPAEEYNITGIDSKHATGKLAEKIKELDEKTKELELLKQGEQKPIKEHNACEFCEDRYGCVSPCSMKLIEEEKFTNKVEPKFKIEEGKWYVCTQTYVLRGKIVVIKGQTYQAEKDNAIKGEDGCLFIDKHDGKASDYFRLWTIQDAKAGDVLEFGDHGRLVVGIVSYVNKTTGKVDVNCLLENNNFKVGNYYNLDTIKPHPATKEQRNLLFQKMKESGYEWDAEKKELKKIEEKKDIHNKLTAFEFSLKHIIEEAIECGDIHNLKADADLLLKIAQKTSWSEEDIELLDNTIKFIEDRVAATSPSLRTYIPTLTGKEIPFLKALKDRVQLKQEWSEEDNRMCKAIIDNIQAICEEGYFVGNIDSDELIKWLNSLKDKVQPQQEWSEEDERIYKSILYSFAHNYPLTVQQQEFVKSLRPQINVTDEELAQAKKDAYNDVLDKIEYDSENPTFDDGWSAAIWYLKKRNAQPQSLYEQLKKLKG